MRDSWAQAEGVSIVLSPCLTFLTHNILAETCSPFDVSTKDMDSEGQKGAVSTLIPDQDFTLFCLGCFWNACYHLIDAFHRVCYNISPASAPQGCWVCHTSSPASAPQGCWVCHTIPPASAPQGFWVCYNICPASAPQGLWVCVPLHYLSCDIVPQHHMMTYYFSGAVPQDYMMPSYFPSVVPQDYIVFLVMCHRIGCVMHIVLPMRTINQEKCYIATVV